jgi:hypothetical protein
MVVGYFSVKDESEPVAGDREAKDILLSQSLLPGDCGQVGIHHHDVGLDGMQGHAESRHLVEGFGEASGSLVVFYKPFGEGFERDNPTGGEDSRLTHSSPHSLSVNACFFYKILRTG